MSLLAYGVPNGCCRLDKIDTVVVSPTVAFLIFLSAHVVAALFSPILDCDETFNFWEPTHFLNHGYGMQTWEFSPDYAIRSWLYISIHAVPIFFASISPIFPKFFEFYFMRCVLAVACATCETRLYAVVSQAMNPRIGLYLLTCMVTSAGMFHAAIAYLPSSFAMYCVMLAVAAFMDRRTISKTATGLTWLAAGTIIGWPFVGILSLPFVLEQFVLSVLNGEAFSMLLRLLDGIGRSLIILVFD